LDHSWGLNVAAQGLGDLGATLAARDLAFGPVPLWVTNANDGVQYLSVHVPADTSPDAPYVMNWQPMIGRHFPYLRIVPPDVPV